MAGPLEQRTARVKRPSSSRNENSEKLTAPPSPKLTIQKRRLEIRRLLSNEARPEEVLTILRQRGFQTSLASYYRDVKALQAQDHQWIQDQAKGQFVTDYRKAIEALREQVRAAQVIRERAEKDYDKLMATQLIVEIEVQIIDLIAQGPSVFGVKGGQ